MQLLPHTICLMALRGEKTVHGRNLPSKEEALQILQKLSRQEFGYNADRWAEWLRQNRKGLYTRHQPVPVQASWLTPTVLALARSAFKERLLPEGTLDPARLAVLADALEEAGCGDTEILEHLRGAGPHVQGCWVVDLILQKA